MSSGSFKNNVTYKVFTYETYIDRCIECLQNYL